MDDYEIRQSVHRLISGYVFVGNYIIDIPSPSILAQADNIYNNFLYQNRFENMLDESRAEHVLMRYGMWSLEEQQYLKEIPEQLETAKLNLYKNALVPSAQTRIRNHIKSLKTEYNELAAKQTAFDQYTLQNLAEAHREKFIYSNVILNNNYEKVSLTPIQLEKFIVKSKKQDISIKKYRELARNDYWQGIWAASKTDSFRAIGEEQRTLISYTHLYENVAKHPEGPNDDVIKDDDMLDGWMVFIRKQHEQEKKTKDFDKISGDNSKHGEHFIMAKTPEDVRQIIDMNDTRGKMIQKKIHKGAEKGAFNEYDIQEIQQDANIIQR